MSAPEGRLYGLVPLAYRTLDAQRGYPLRALLAVLEHEFSTIESDIAALHDDWFVETCRPEVAGRIAELIGLKVAEDGGSTWDPRPFVADALGIRRRKGTAAATRVAARGLTGCPALVIEGDRLVGITQAVDHVRLARGSLLDVRDPCLHAGAGALFSAAARTLAVRSVPSATSAGALAGRDAVEVVLWPVEARPLERVTAFESGAGCYTLHPLGVDAPLLWPPRTEAGSWAPVDPRALPRRIGRAELRALLDAAAQDKAAVAAVYRVLRLATVKGGRLRPVLPSRMAAADLDAWPPEPVGRRILVDPEAGRIRLPPELEADELVVSGWLGFTGDLGGGEGRVAADPPADEPPCLTVSREAPRRPGLRTGEAADGDVRFTELADALAAWQRMGGSTRIRLADSRSYRWPDGLDLELGPERQLSLTAGQGCTPTILGDVRVGAADARGARLMVDGIWFGGSLSLEGELQAQLWHCTLRPGREPALRLADASGSPEVRLDAVVCGGVRSRAGAAALHVRDSLVGEVVGDDGSGRPRGALHARRATFLGPVRVEELAAEDSIFAGEVHVGRRDVGGIAFSVLPTGSRAPVLRHAVAFDPAGPAPAREATPHFVSRRFGHPAFARLAATCSDTLRRMASDGGEPGAFHHAGETQRLDRARTLDDFLPAESVLAMRQAW